MTTKTANFDPKKIEEQRFEFILYINNHIICQRYFHIRDFNDESLNSWEIKQLMDSICGINNGEYGTLGIIPNFLKKKSIDYSWSIYNPYSVQSEQNIRNPNEKIDDFQFEIRVDKKTVAKSMFPGNLFPPKVRYAVDIKEIIPAIMGEIRDILSQKKYTEVVA